ncbi:MAG: 30S ribosomal protein S7 [Bacteroidetes bacterium]|nr:30S ribosomal protein S7 [Bacteroidota bacterium]MCY4232396.1 30S ribosomal protein S7 [Bacteroidota bacterium]
MRRKSAERRTIAPDPKYSDQLVAQFVNYVMLHGKKTIARRIVYDAIARVEEKSGEPGLDVFRNAVENVAPLVEVRSRRVGGATYQVPIEVRAERRTALAFRWIIQNAAKRSDRSMAERLAGELFAASRGEGAAVKKKDDTHRMAESNKAFAHFRL